MPKQEHTPESVKRFVKEGFPVPEGIEFIPKDFEAKLRELRANEAADFARRYKLGKAVETLLDQLGLDGITPEVCGKFVQENPEFESYHPALVRAVAEAIDAENKMKDLLKKTLH